MQIDYLPGWTESILWVVIVAFLIAFVLGFALGANDCANSYGPAVGSGVLKLWHAYALASVFEILGALLLGYKVTNTFRKNIINVHIYDINVLTNGTEGAPPVYVDSCSPFTSATNHSSSALFSSASSSVSPIANIYGLDHDQCTTQTDVSLALGALGILGGSAIWLLIATFFKLPVSTTHSAVGATIGFSLTVKGTMGIQWFTVMKIVLSWLVSPLFSGFFSVMFYVVIKACALNKKDPFESSLALLPWMFFFTVSLNVFSVTYDGSRYLYLHLLPWWTVLIISLAIGASVGLAVRLFGIRRIRKSVLDGAVPNDDNGTVLVEMNSTVIDSKRSPPIEPVVMPNLEGRGILPCDLINPLLETRKSTDVEHQAPVLAFESETKINRTFEEDAKTTSTFPEGTVCNYASKVLHRQEEPLMASKVYSSLQVLSSVFLSFSHGSNDTANAVGPLVALWVVYRSGNALSESTKGEWAIQGLIVYGAAAMIIGLWCLGHKVIETVGSEITQITPASGFCMQVGTAFTVLFCSKIGIPVSTTHCLVGAVVAVGWFKSKSGVSWKLFGGIGCAWLVTLPAAGLISALITWVLTTFV